VAKSGERFLWSTSCNDCVFARDKATAATGLGTRGGAYGAVERMRSGEDETEDADSSVSVLIDTYNYGHFVEERLDSVLAQDFPRKEGEILFSRG